MHPIPGGFLVPASHYVFCGEKWDVSSVEDMSYMFGSAISFNGDLPKWIVSSVTTMYAMFNGATSFNGDISKWDVSRVEDMSDMFWIARSFNRDISKWDVSSVEDMSNMFTSATAFNYDVSKWDVSNVERMDFMFAETTAYEHVLSEAAWVNSKASKTEMFEDSWGSIARRVHPPLVAPPRTTLVTHQYSTHQPIIERELIVPTPFRTSTPAVTSTSTNRSTCPKCGTFEKSGRVSCCAPGGTWFKKCGGAGNRNVDHRWFEGLETCKRKFKAKRMCAMTRQ